MICASCSAESTGIRDGNAIWCDNCGHVLKEDIQYVTGYCQSHSCRTQVYCRVKRFGKYIRKVCKGDSVLQRYHQIVDLYSRFEFSWLRNRHLSKRIYFFAKPVMLQMCCHELELECENFPRLKDKNREVDQLRELTEIRASKIWDQMYGSKMGECRRSRE